MKKFISLICFLLSISYSFSQLTVTTGIPATTLVQNVLVGGGVTISNVTYTGHANAIGQFQTGANPTNLGISEGIVMSSGVVNGTPAIGTPVSNFASSSNGTSGDALLNSLVSGTTYDASILEFDFVPLSDTIRFRYVFGSEEYLEWVGSSFNDVFGFFVTGPNPLGGTYTNRNIALIPNTMIPVAINNIHTGSYSQYYVNNEAIGGTTIVFDGFTTVLTAWLKVTPCQTYHIKLAIADAGDSSYDSAVFLEANSFGTSGVTVDTDYSIPAIGNFAVEGCNDAILTFCLPQTSPNNYNIPVQVGGTSTNGVDHTMVPSQITIPAGTLCTDFIIQAFIDNITEGIEILQIIVQTDLCGAVDTINIEIHDYFQPQLTTSNDTTICIGDSALIMAIGSLGISPYEYTWSNIPYDTTTQTVSPPSAAVYTVTVTDMCNQTVTADIQIEVATTDVDAGNDVTICEDETTNLTATGGTSYLWSDGSGTATITVSPDQTTTYFVTATGVCIPVDSVTVFVSPGASVTLTQPPTVCAGEQIQIVASGGETYIWSSSPPDGTLNSQINNATINVKPHVTTVYSVTAANSYGCTGSAQVTADIYPNPEADFLIDPPAVSSFEPMVTFTDISGGSPVTWYWDFGDLSNSDEQNPVHFYSDSGGVYPVMLIVTNIYGCRDSIIKNAIVKPDFVIYIPNAFSPENNGINDEIIIFSTGVSERDFHWIIFNRWGNIVFESKDLHQGWDGKYDGTKAPGGMYTYRLIFRDKANLLHERFGNILLLY
jgi:gliding motility-associated-like protein